MTAITYHSVALHGRLRTQSPFDRVLSSGGLLNFPIARDPGASSDSGATEQCSGISACRKETLFSVVKYLLDSLALKQCEQILRTVKHSENFDSIFIRLIEDQVFVKTGTDLKGSNAS